MELFQFNGTLLKSETLLESAMIHLYDPERMKTTGYTIAERKIEAVLVELKGARQRINDICTAKEKGTAA